MENSFKDLMNDFCGKTRLSVEDVRWGELIEYTSDIFSLNCGDENVLFYFRKLVENGPSSSNLAVLIQIVTKRLRQLRANVSKKAMILRTSFEQICSFLHLLTLILNYLLSTQQPNTIKKVLVINQAWPTISVSDYDNSWKSLIDESIHASCNYSDMYYF